MPFRPGSPVKPSAYFPNPNRPSPRGKAIYKDCKHDVVYVGVKAIQCPRTACKHA